MKETADLAKVPHLLQDIIDNAESIFRYTEGMNIAAFKEDEKHLAPSNAASGVSVKRFQGAVT